MKEKWLPLVGYEAQYEVSSLGRFRSSITKKIKSCTPMYAGYLTIKLSRNKTAKTYRAHSLVLETFVGPRPNGRQTRHLNGKRDDNRLINLRWGTVSENHSDKVRHGTDFSNYKGKHFTDHPNGKLSEPLAKVLVHLNKHFDTKFLAKMAGVSMATLQRLRRENPTWSGAEGRKCWSDERRRKHDMKRERSMGRQAT